MAQVATYLGQVFGVDQRLFDLAAEELKARSDSAETILRMRDQLTAATHAELALLAKRVKQAIESPLLLGQELARYITRFEMDLANRALPTITRLLPMHMVLYGVGGEDQTAQSNYVAFTLEQIRGAIGVALAELAIAHAQHVLRVQESITNERLLRLVGGTYVRVAALLHIAHKEFVGRESGGPSPWSNTGGEETYSNALLRQVFLSDNVLALVDTSSLDNVDLQALAHYAELLRDIALAHRADGLHTMDENIAGLRHLISDRLSQRSEMERADQAKAVRQRITEHWQAKPTEFEYLTGGEAELQPSPAKEAEGSESETEAMELGRRARSFANVGVPQ
jgi:hypothetical protein